LGNGGGSSAKLRDCDVAGSEGLSLGGHIRGLARFDSARFRVFASADTPGFSSGRILSLYESRSGELWVGTLDGGLIRLHDGTATTYRERDGLPSSFVSSIRGDARGNVWVNTSRGVPRFAGIKLEPYAGHRGTTVKKYDERGSHAGIGGV
jgi:ligand-binding sensor domain-containing protein